MTSRRSALLVSVLGVVALAAAAPALSQSYGPGDQILTIPAAAFKAENSEGFPYTTSEGYLYGPGLYTAPVELPDGAQVTLMCVYVYDPDAPSDVFTLFDTYGLVAGGQSPLFHSDAEVDANFDIGFGVACSGPLSFTVHRYDDGVGENLGHYLETSIIANGGLGGVTITWHRQVSPAPGSATFNDVPTSDPAFQHIEALVASGITAGCGGGKYCPDAALTRRQMAVFLAKALGLHWAY